MNAFIDATPYESDAEQLEELFEEHGYWLLRQFIDPEESRRLADECLAAFRALGVVPEKASVDEFPVPDRRVPAAEIDRRVDRDAFWNRRATVVGLERLFGGPVRFSGEDNRIRYNAAGDDVRLAPAHQDGWYLEHRGWSFGEHSFRTVWTPLLPSDVAVGGLALADASHKRGLRRHVNDPTHGGDLSSSTLRILDGDVEEDYHFGPMEPGDVLIFDAHMVHKSVPNRSSGNVRLSVDTRVYPAHDPPLQLRDEQLRRRRAATGSET